MCGIWALLQLLVKQESGAEYYNYFTKIAHRGPDRSYYIEVNSPAIIKLGFHRLSIMDPSTKGDQPFKYEVGSRTVYVLCNGEIYNFRELCTKYNLQPKSGSDCEVIPLIYEKYGIDCLVSEI